MKEITENESVKIWAQARYYADRLRVRYHLTDEEVEDARGDLYAAAIKAVQEKCKADASAVTFAAGVCRLRKKVGI